MAKSDTGPFALVPEWVVDLPISDRALRLYAVLARYADRDDEAWPRRSLLAERMRCSVDSIDRATIELIDAGALEKHHRSERGSNISNLYRIIRVDPAAIARPPSREDATSPSREAAAQNESQLEREPLNDIAEQAPLLEGEVEPRAKRTRRRTPRDDLFEALVMGFGPASTPSRAAFYGRAVTQLLAAAALPEQVIQARVAMSRRGWTDPTPEAMLKHWDDLIASSKPPVRRVGWEEMAEHDARVRGTG